MRYAETPAVQEETFVEADPDALWTLITDIHLIARLSSELIEVEWLDDVTEPAVGCRFRGRNYHRQVGEWETTSYVVECDRPHAFAWAVENVEHPSAMWRFSVRPAEGGSTLIQWAQLGPGPSNLSVVIERMPEKEERIVEGRLSEFRAGIEANLAGIKALAEKALDPGAPR
jgi:hypothetical protein